MDGVARSSAGNGVVGDRRADPTITARGRLFSFILRGVIVGIGIDIVQLGRIRDMVGRHGDRFLARIFTEGERAYCARMTDAVPSLAARFAAKEAVLKALGTGWSRGIGWRDVEVVRGETGPPRIELHGEAAAVAAHLGANRFHLSLTHDGGAAVAVAVLEAVG
jgi:holo-[acyl-carrier protein] synthase